jgi:hypothetical protein
MGEFFKRLKKKLSIKLYRICRNLSITESRPKLDSIQFEMASTIRKMMSNQESNLLIAPISNICYIEWKHYFIRFGDSSATITNGKFSYYIWLPSATTDRLRRQFYNHSEERRMKLEGTYDKKTLKNLKTVSGELSKELISSRPQK